MTSSDSELRERLAGPAEDWVREAPPPGAHLDADELIAYRTGSLSNDEQRRIQDHLELCRVCVEHLLELDSFAGAEPEDGGSHPAGGVADLETAAAWRALRPRLPAAEGESSSVESSAVRRMPGWLSAAAAVLALAVVGLTVDSARLHERLEMVTQPHPLTPVNLPEPEVRGDPGTGPAAERASQSGSLALFIRLSSERLAGPYELEIRDTERRLRWSGRGYEPDPLGVLGLGVPAGFLAPGDYTLEVYAAGPGGRQVVDTFPLRVRDR